MNEKEKMKKKAEKLMEVSIKVHQECADYYPKHLKIVRKLVSIFMDYIMFGKHDLMRFYEYVCSFSD